MIYVIYTCIAVAAMLYLAQAFYLFVASVFCGSELGMTLTLWRLIKLTLMVVFWPVTLVIFWIDGKLSDPRG